VCFFAVVVTLAPGRGYAQFTDPRAYTNSPVDTNQVELLYAYARSNTSIDSSLIVGGAKFNLNSGIITYTRYFGLLHHLAWVEPSVPIAVFRGPSPERISADRLQEQGIRAISLGCC
jgi:hypothetical protein